MASVYDYVTGWPLTAGLQGCQACDEAIKSAQYLADTLRRPVQLTDDDGDWVVYPAHADGTRELADPLDLSGDDGEDGRDMTPPYEP